MIGTRKYLFILIFLWTWVTIRESFAYQVRIVDPSPEATDSPTASPSPSSTPIIEWSRNIFDIDFDETDTHPKPIVSLEGRYLVKLGVLLSGTGGNMKKSTPVPYNQKTYRFHFPLQVGSREQKLEFFSIDSFGNIVREKKILKVENFDRLQDEIKNPKMKTLFIEAGFGYTSVQYQESLMPNLSENATTAKLSSTYLINKNWNLGLSGYYTAAVLSSNQAGVTGQYLGINMRVGYFLPGFNGPLKLEIKGGGFYTDFMITGNTFGYSNLMGPQVYPAIHYQLNKKNRIAVYFKYAPIVTGGMDPTKSQELATGAAWIHRLAHGKSVSLGLDISSLHLNYQDSWQATSNIVSIGLSYSFGFLDRPQN